MILAVLALVPAAAVAVPTVAVMPFADLSRAGGSAGEAIRETVTSDLKAVGGLRVVERTRIDAVLAEAKLQASRAELDAASSARVGRLLGATLIATGAYQRVGGDVRLTARFVRVETGEIVGTAKVDGKVADFLSLQDRVTAALLRSAGLLQRSAEVARRTRPRLRSARTIELYGDAVVATDPERKKALLHEALAADPGFSYAAADLDALEARLRVYDARSVQANDAVVEALTKKARAAHSADDANMAYWQMFGHLLTQRRWRRILVECDRLRAHPPPRPTTASIPAAVENCDFFEVQARQQLADWDGALRAGEKFIATWPTSIWFDGVRNLMNAIIRDEREDETNRKAAAAELATLPAPARSDPCRLQELYRRYRQFKSERPYLEQCIRGGGGGHPLVELYEALADACQLSGDFSCQRNAIEALRSVDAAAYERDRMQLSTTGRDD